MHYQLCEANQHLADYNSTIDNMQKLQEENAKLKEYFWKMLKECKGMRRSTLLVAARVRHYELEFESIQQEWNRNGRVRNMILTSWLGEEKMYKDNWWTADLPIRLDNGSIDWKRVTEANHRWNVEEVHAYPYHMIGQKLWPNPHPVVRDGSVWLLLKSIWL